MYNELLNISNYFIFKDKIGFFDAVLFPSDNEYSIPVINFENVVIIENFKEKKFEEIQDEYLKKVTNNKTINRIGFTVNSELIIITG